MITTTQNDFSLFSFNLKHPFLHSLLFSNKKEPWTWVVDDDKMILVKTFILLPEVDYGYNIPEKKVFPWLYDYHTIITPIYSGKKGDRIYTRMI